MSEIYRSFTSPEAPRCLNIDKQLLKQMNADIKTTTLNTLPAMELIFSDAQLCVENVLATDIYPRFVKHQMTVSAERALSSSRSKYGGLGDCFCLTNPLSEHPTKLVAEPEADLSYLAKPTTRS